MKLQSVNHLCLCGNDTEKSRNLDPILPIKMHWWFELSLKHTKRWSGPFYTDQNKWHSNNTHRGCQIWSQE